MKLPLLTYSALLTSTLFASAASFAQNIADTGWFVGGQLSQADLTLDYRNEKYLDFDAPMLEARGGFRFSPYFALESTLGLTATSSTSNDRIDDAALFKFSTAAKLIAPISDRVQLYANAGLALLSYAQDTDYSYNSYRRYENESYVGNCFLIGLGAEFEISPHLILRVAYDSMEGELENSDDYYYSNAIDLDASLSQIGVGLHYQF
jgi:opacity protein-like surface antigen